MSKSHKPRPRFLLTYLCNTCGFDYTRFEGDLPECFYCESTDNFTIIRKEKITGKTMKIATERLVENLEKAYPAGKQ